MNRVRRAEDTAILPDLSLHGSHSSEASIIDETSDSSRETLEYRLFLFSCRGGSSPSPLRQESTSFLWHRWPLVPFAMWGDGVPKTSIHEGPPGRRTDGANSSFGDAPSGGPGGRGGIFALRGPSVGEERCRRPNGTQSILGVEHAVTWVEKVGRTIETTRLQSIGNIDSCLNEEFFLLQLREHRYQNSPSPLPISAPGRMRYAA
jgi:hypothetical protein